MKNKVLKWKKMLEILIKRLKKNEYKILGWEEMTFDLIMNEWDWIIRWKKKHIMLKYKKMIYTNLIMKIANKILLFKFIFPYLFIYINIKLILLIHIF